MRFSTVAASAALVGIAMALPANVIYETEVVTVTSCAPGKTDCPYRSQTPYAVPTTTQAAYPTTTPCETSTPVKNVPKYTTTTTPCETSTPVKNVPKYTTTTTPCETTTTVKPVPEYTTTPCSTATGYPTYTPHYHNATVTYHPSCPGGEHCLPPHTYAPPPPPAYTTATAVPYPVNTSSPHPAYPPPSEGAASRMGVSIVAVAGAAVLALLA